MNKWQRYKFRETNMAAGFCLFLCRANTQQMSGPVFSPLNMAKHDCCRRRNIQLMGRLDHFKPLLGIDFIGAQGFAHFIVKNFSRRAGQGS